MSRKKVLFLIGSPNQTTQMHQIAQLLDDEFEPYFSQLYYDGWQRPFYKFLLWIGRAGQNHCHRENQGQGR